MLSPETTEGAFGSTTKSAPVVIKSCAAADCSSRGVVVAVRGVLTPATIRIVPNKRKLSPLMYL
jgi:hypothetical protein